MAPIMAVILRESGVSSNAAAGYRGTTLSASGITMQTSCTPGAFGLLGVTRGIRPQLPGCSIV